MQGPKIAKISKTASQVAFEIVTNNGDCLRDDTNLDGLIDDIACEIDRLTVENWQLKGALGYEVPGDIPPGNFKCGMCDARSRAFSGKWPPEEEPSF